MRTAVMGLLALTAASAVISVVATTPVNAQVADIDAAYEEPSAAEAPPLEAAPEEIPADTGEEPAPEEVLAQDGEAAPDTQVDLGTFLTTGYALRGHMRSGNWTYYGAIAVDPRVIPLGSTVYIEDMGYFVAEDTGGGVRGAHIDIWLSSHHEAINYGVQYRRAWLVN